MNCVPLIKHPLNISVNSEHSMDQMLRFIVVYSTLSSARKEIITPGSHDNFAKFIGIIKSIMHF